MTIKAGEIKAGELKENHRLAPRFADWPTSASVVSLLRNDFVGDEPTEATIQEIQFESTLAFNRRQRLTLVITNTRRSEFGSGVRSRAPRLEQAPAIWFPATLVLIFWRPP
jgi:hypothetical protein